MVIKDNENNPLLESAKLIFQALVDDPDYQATDNQTREEVVMGEAIQRANQSHRNNLALSLGSDLEKFQYFLKAEKLSPADTKLVRSLTTENQQQVGGKGKDRTIIGFNTGVYLFQNHGVDSKEKMQQYIDFIVNSNLIGKRQYQHNEGQLNQIRDAIQEGKTTLEGTGGSGASGGSERGASSSAATPPPSNKVEFVTRLTPKLLKDNPDKIYLFGDNVADRNTKKKGKGQAAIRGLPNAFGIPTKHSAKTTDDAYFKDDEASLKIITDAFLELAEKHPDKTIVIPVNKDGKHTLGKGLAKLEEKAPQTLAILDGIINAISDTEIPESPQPTPSPKPKSSEIKTPSRQVGKGTDVRLEAQNRVNDILGSAVKNGALDVMKPIADYRPKGNDHTPQNAMRFFVDPYTEAGNIAREVPYDLKTSIEPHLIFLEKLNEAREDGLWKGDEIATGEINDQAILLSQILAMEGDFSRKLENSAKGKAINYNRLLSNGINGYFNVFGHKGLEELLNDMQSNQSKRPDAETYGVIQDARIQIANDLLQSITSVSLPQDQIDGVDEDGQPKLSTWRTIANQYQGIAETLYGEDAPLRAVSAKISNFQKAKILTEQYINKYGLTNAMSPPRDTVQFYELQHIQHATRDWWKLFPRGRQIESPEAGMPRPVIAAMEAGHPEVARRIMMRYNADPDLYKNPTRQLNLTAGQQIIPQLKVLGSKLYDESPELFADDFIRTQETSNSKNFISIPTGTTEIDPEGTGEVRTVQQYTKVHMDDLMSLLYLVGPETARFNHKTNYPKASHSDIENLEVGENHKEVVEALTPYIEKIKALESKYGGIGDIYLYGNGADNIVNNGETTPNLKLGVRLYALSSGVSHYDHFDPDAFKSDKAKVAYQKRIKALQKDFTVGIQNILKDIEPDAGIVVKPHVHFNNNPSELVGNRLNQREPGQELNYIHFPGDYQFGQIPALGPKNLKPGGQLPFDPYLNGNASQKRLSHLLPEELFDESGGLKEEHLKKFKKGDGLSFELASQALSREELIYYLRHTESEHARKWQDKWNQMHDLETEDAFDENGNPSSEYAIFMMADANHQDAFDALNRLNSSSYRQPTEELIDELGRIAGDGSIGWTMPDLDPLINPDVEGNIEELAQSIMYDAETDMLRITPELLETVSELISNFGSEGYLPASRIQDEEATYDFLVKRMKLQNEVSEKRQHLADLMGTDQFGHDDPDQLTARNDIIASEAKLRELVEDPANFNSQGNAINGLAVVTQAENNVRTTRNQTRKAHDDYLYGPLTGAENPDGSKVQTRRVIGTTELGHKGQEVPQPMEILVDERKGGREEFYRNEQQDLLNILEGATISGYNEETGEAILDDSLEEGQGVKLPGLLTDLQNRLQNDEGKFTTADSKKPVGFQNIRVDLVWTNPEDSNNKIIVGHLMPVNMGEILSRTAARFLESKEAASFKDFQTLFTPDELANLQYTLLPATPDTQGFGKDAKPVPLLEAFQPPTRTIEGGGVDGSGETDVPPEEMNNLIQEVLRTGRVNGVDVDGNPTEEAINIAGEILKANGYSDERIDNFSLDQVIKRAKEEQADAEDQLITSSVGDYEGGIVFDRNSEGDVYIKNTSGAETIIINDDNIDDDWGLVATLEKYHNQMERAREIEIETLYESTPEKYTQSMGTRDRLGNFKYSLGDELDLGDNADFDALQQKIRNGLTKKGMFDLSKEDSASELLEGILGGLSFQYGDAEEMSSVFNHLNPRKLTRKLEQNKQLINDLSPEARQYFLTTFLGRAYKREQYFNEQAKKYKEGFSITEARKIMNSSLDFGQSDPHSLQDRADIYFKQIMKESKEYSDTGIHPAEATMYIPIGHEALQIQKESHALRQFRNKYAQRTMTDEERREAVRIVKPIEIVNTLQWLSDYFLREGTDEQATFVQEREGHPFQYVINPETNQYYTPEDEQGNAKLYYETGLRDIITNIRENLIDEDFMPPAALGEALQYGIKAFTDEGWTRNDPEIQNNIAILATIDKMSESIEVDYAGDNDDIVDSGNTPPGAVLSIIQQLALAEVTSPLSLDQGMDSDSIETVLPADLFSVYGANAGKWVSEFKSKFPYYTAIAKSFGYDNVRGWLEDEHLIEEGQTLKSNDIKILDQKIKRWGKASRSGSQVQHLIYEGGGRFTIVNRGSGTKANIQENISEAFDRAQKHVDKIVGKEGTWSSIIAALDFQEGDVNKDQITSLIKILRGLENDPTHGKALRKGKRNPLTQSIESLKRLDVRGWDQSLANKQRVGDQGQEQGPSSSSGKGYGYQGRSASEYIEDQIDELLKVASIAGVTASTGQTMTITEYDQATQDEPLLKGIEAENAMLAYVQQAIEDIIVQAPDVLHNARESDPTTYKNVSEQDLSYNSIYILLNELFANYFPSLPDSQGTDYQGIDWGTHISEQGKHEIVTEDEPSDRKLTVSDRKVISSDPLTNDLSKVGFFRKYARPFKEDGETHLYMNHNWQRIIPIYDHQASTAQDFTYKQYDYVDGKSQVLMDAANNIIAYGIYDDETGSWDVYSERAIEFGENNELIPQADPLFSITGSVYDRNFVKGYPSDVESDGSHTVLNADKDSLTEASSILNETGRIPVTKEVLEAHFGNKLSVAWRRQLAKIEGLSIEDIEKYFSENVKNWNTLKRPHALFTADKLRDDGQIYRRDNLTPFKDWWTGEKERQATEENGINPVTNKPHAWKVIETFKGHETTKTRIKNNYPDLYDYLFTPEGLLKIDQDGNHEQLEALHKFFTDHGLQGIEIGEDETSKTKLKDVVVTMLNASDNILQGTPPEGLSEEASANFQQFAADNEWDISETQLGSAVVSTSGEPEIEVGPEIEVDSTEEEGDVVRAASEQEPIRQSGTQENVGPTEQTISDDPNENVQFSTPDDPEAMENIKVSKQVVADFINRLPQEAQEHAKASIEPKDGRSQAYADSYFLIRDGKYNKSFIGLNENMALSEEERLQYLNHFANTIDAISDKINLVNKNDDRAGDIITLTPRGDHPLKNKDIVVIGSKLRSVLKDPLASEPSDGPHTTLGGLIVPPPPPDPPEVDEERANKIKRIMGKKFGDFQYQDDKGKPLEAEDTEVWHYLAHIQEMSDEELKAEYKKEYINKLSGEKQGGMSQDQRTSTIKDIHDIMIQTHKLTNPTGDPLELDTDFLEGLTDDKLRAEKAKRAETLHTRKQAEAHGRLKLEANYVPKFGKFFATVMEGPNEDNVMQLARELRIHRKKFDNATPIEMDNTGKVATPWITPKTAEALYEGPESVYGQISQIINPATGQPYLNEAALNEQEQEIISRVTNEEGIIDGPKLLEELENVKTVFANKVKADAEKSNAFLKFLEDGQFNYAEREDSLANILYTQEPDGEIWEHSSGQYATETGETFGQGISRPAGNQLTNKHIIGGESTSETFSPSQIPWDQAPLIYSKRLGKLVKASFWNGMWVNPWVLSTVMSQIRGEGDLFLRNPEILNLTREKYNIPTESITPDGEIVDVTDDMLRVIIPIEGEQPRSILITQQASIFPLPSNDNPLTAEDGEQTTDTLIAYALSQALGLTLDSPDIERDSNGEIAPALLVTQMDDQGRIVHIPWNTFTGTVIGEEPDEEAVQAAREETAERGEGTAAQFLARLRGQPDEVVQETTALQQLYESNKIPLLRGIVNFIDDIKGKPHTHMWRQAYNMTIVQEQEEEDTATRMREAIGLTQETEEQKKQKANEEARQAVEEKYRAKLIGTEYTRLRNEGMPEEEAWDTAGQTVETQLTTPATPAAEEVLIGQTPFDSQTGTPPPIVPDPQASPEGEVNIPEGEENMFDTGVDPDSLPPFLEGRETKKSAVGSLQEFLSS